jgi:hypothetical protein
MALVTLAPQQQHSWTLIVCLPILLIRDASPVSPRESKGRKKARTQPLWY